ncbi:hypothetical protein C7B80_30095 [Cyanosarcina cf. burmensis CCALA 770]|nr:hypothetical protein C7B80_30095 [Cyanosarcina cf. burmensis CCALA 770]
MTLTAFLAALKQLNEPLPDGIQIQLHAIGKVLEVDSTNLGNLDAIAESYPPLDEFYQQELAALEKEVGERNKGLPPLPLSTEPTRELTNTAIDTFTADDSVVTAKQAVNQSFLTRIWQLVTGSKE